MSKPVCTSTLLYQERDVTRRLGGISETILDALVESGVIPPPIKFPGGRKRFWHAEATDRAIEQYVQKDPSFEAWLASFEARASNLLVA